MHLELQGEDLIGCLDDARTYLETETGMGQSAICFSSDKRKKNSMNHLFPATLVLRGTTKNTPDPSVHLK